MIPKFAHSGRGLLPTSTTHMLWHPPRLTFHKAIDEANERQRVLFQELQHRVANTLHSMAATLEIARGKINSAPAEAGRILDRTMRRIGLLSDMHRCLNNPTLFDKGFGSILNDAVATVIDPHSTYISFQVDELDLSFDQMSVITMIVIEVANNAQKHVFGRNLGEHFLVSFRAVSDNRAALLMKDDGPGWSKRSIYAGRTLGLTILKVWQTSFMEPYTSHRKRNGDQRGIPTVYARPAMSKPNQTFVLVRVYRDSRKDLVCEPILSACVG